MISELNFTKLTASNFSVNLFVIPTATPTLSSLLANTTTIPSPNSFYHHQQVFLTLLKVSLLHFEILF